MSAVGCLQAREEGASIDHAREGRGPVADREARSWS